MVKDSNLRSFVKGVSWRLLGSIDTFLLGWIIFDDVKDASQIAFLELTTKIVLYFLHERAWNAIKVGRRPDGSVAPLRSLIKAVTFRVLASADTAFLAWITTGKVAASFTLSGFELATKLGLFYLHERLWTKIKWGRIYEGEPVKKEKTVV